MSAKKRKSGGGRKPKGPIRDKRQTFSTRITGPMRESLEKEAAKTGQSISQVAERLLWTGLDSRNRSQTMRPLRALAYLFERLALASCDASDYRPPDWLEKRIERWRTDPFMFQSFKTAVGMLLDFFEPQGPVLSPLDFRRVKADVSKTELTEQDWQNAVGRFYETPDIHAAYIFSWLLRELLTEQVTDRRARFMAGPGFLTETAFSDFYGLQNARRDLGLDALEERE